MISQNRLISELIKQSINRQDNYLYRLGWILNIYINILHRIKFCINKYFMEIYNLFLATKYNMFKIFYLTLIYDIRYVILVFWKNKIIKFKK
jgi:hypothetical protein